MNEKIRWKEHPEYEAFLEEYIPGHEEHEIRKAFKDKFGLYMTEGMIGNAKKRLKVKSGTHGGRFQKGFIPANKGKPMSAETYKKCAGTMFKPGNAPVNHKEVGTVRINVDGYYEIKIAEPDRWQLMQRYIWEKEKNVKLDKNQVIIFLDSNRLNCSIDNLACVTRAELVRLNQSHRFTNNAELTRIGIGIEKLKGKIRDKSHKWDSKKGEAYGADKEILQSVRSS